MLEEIIPLIPEIEACLNKNVQLQVDLTVSQKAEQVSQIKEIITNIISFSFDLNLIYKKMHDRNLDKVKESDYYKVLEIVYRTLD